LAVAPNWSDAFCVRTPLIAECRPQAFDVVQRSKKTPTKIKTGELAY